MFHRLVISALGSTVLLFPTAAFAQGTAADAKAMLEKTVAAIKADKRKALDEINKGENGFLVGDIYPLCFNLDDGALVAIGNPNAKQSLGQDVSLTNMQIYAAAKEGQINEVTYEVPKPGPDKTPRLKATFVTAVAGLGCGVGYYK
jgi:hypothetical protein